MKRLLNTLFVTTQGAYLSRDNETISVQVEGQTLLRVPIHTLGGVVCFGRVSVSPPLMELCAENKVAISFLSEFGRFFARVQGSVSGNVLLRREQFRWADHPGRSANLARAFVSAKVANCRTVLMRAAREQENPSNGAQALKTAAERMGLHLEHLMKEDSVDGIRGYEGESANLYFGVFDHLITSQKHPRRRRQYRPSRTGARTLRALARADPSFSEYRRAMARADHLASPCSPR